MPTSVCLHCGEQVPFAPEQAGLQSMCPNCHADVVFKQPGLLTAGAIASTIFAVVSTIGLGLFGCLGGIQALAGHGIFMVVVIVLAILSGMRLRTVFFILAVYFASVVFLSIYWTNNSSKKKSSGGARITWISSHLISQERTA